MISIGEKTGKNFFPVRPDCSDLLSPALSSNKERGTSNGPMRSLSSSGGEGWGEEAV
jgi:hypothetical protein